MVDQAIQTTYATKKGLNLGKQYCMKSASRTASAPCKLGKAPNGTGAVVKLVVYISTPNNASNLANPAGDPDMP